MSTMSTMAENAIAVGFKNRPPMLERIKNGPFHFGTIPVPGTATTLIAIRDITMDDLTPKEKVREAMFTHRKAQINFYHIPSRPFYPPDVYSLVYIIMQRVL
ncbi:hypothetical protein Tco_0436315 [Tanacetum coccineum]